MRKTPFFGTDAVKFGFANTTAGVSINTATVAISAVTPGKFRNNTSRSALPAATYNYWLAPVYFDPTGGYTLGQATTTPGSGQAITAGQGLLVRIAQPWTGFTGLAGAIAMALFVQKGAENPVMTDFAFINPSTDFSWLIMTYGDPTAPSFPVATLVSSSILDSNMGTSRTGFQCAYTLLTPTTDGVHYTNKHEGFDFKPDNAANYPVVTVRSTDASFKLLDFQLDLLAQAIGGDYVSFTDTNAATVEQLTTDVVSLASQLPGNQPIMFVKPKKGGRTYQTLMLGNVQVNTADVTIDTQKDAPATIPFTCSHAAIDTLVNGMGNTITYSNG